MINKDKLILPALLGLTLLSNILFAFYFREDLSILTRYWDGPNYMYIAKTLYDIPVNHPMAAYQTTPAYFACHLPLYPLLVRLFSIFGGYEIGMILATWFSTLAFVAVFYCLLKETRWVKSAFWSVLFALFLPARFLVYRETGATEPLFLALVVGTALMAYREKWLWACVLASLAASTRITGILLGPALALYLILQTEMWKQPLAKLQQHYRKILSLALIPIPLLLIFTFYYFQYGNFFAYWSWNQKLLSPMPFQVFQTYLGSGKTHSTEFYFLLYAANGLGLILLATRKLWLPFSICVFTYILNLFIVHEDVSRYFLVITPFTLIVAYDSVMQSRAAKIFFCVILVPLVYLYAWRLIPHNLIFDDIYQNLIHAIK